MSFRVGKDGSCRVGSAAIKIRKWKVDPKADMFDITNSESGKVTDYTTGHVDIKVTIEMHYEIGSAPYTTFNVGSTISTVKLFVDGAATTPTGTIYWDIPTLVVESVPHESEVRGMQTLVVTGQATGTVVAPVT